MNNVDNRNIVSISEWKNYNYVKIKMKIKVVFKPIQNI